MEKSNQVSTLSPKKARQKQFLEIFRHNLFNKSKSCRDMGINRSTVHLWLRDDPEFKEEFEACKEEKFDLVEHSLLSLVARKDVAACIFCAKTLLAHRGFIERTNHTIEVTPIPKQNRDAAVNGLIESIRISDQLNFSPEMRDKLRLPAPGLDRAR